MPAITRRELILVSASAALPASAAFAAYPERPIIVILPYGAGGAGETVLRHLMPIVERKLGQKLVLETRPGAGGNLGAHAVAAAAPDGYTLLLGATNNFVINQFLFRNMPFDPLVAFAPITKLADVPSIIFSNPMVPAHTIGEFVEYARRNPGKLNYGSPSVGTTPHLAIERLKLLTGIALTHVPYRSAPAAIQALITNDIQLYMGGITLGAGHMEAGTIRALAVATDKRLSALPDVPTADESGVPGFTAANWWALAAPRGTSPEVIDLIHAAFAEALRDEGVRKRLHDIGFLASGEPPAAFAASLPAEAKLWAQTIERAKLWIE